MEKEPISNLYGQRTLAAVVFTDAVNFSARMSNDEDRTLEMIRRDLRLMRLTCERFNGKVLKSTGDGLLMFFTSAVKAVECSVEIQRALTEAAEHLPDADALQHRIGIHLGDIFISETDVMGNGVNIAARLQSQADPGGICISQTVYDVVKSGLHLGTVYLGPRALKNIREVVHIYKIRLPFQPQYVDLYSEVVRRLANHPTSIRIKKLILYTCHNRWENDLAVLNALDLRQLIEELHRNTSTPDRLKFLLKEVVKTLSKPAEYALVADLILQELAPIYTGQSYLQPAVQASPDATQISLAPLGSFGTADATQIGAVALPGSNLTASEEKIAQQYHTIAQDLAQHSNAVRIKKLLFFACKNYWENTPAILDEVNLPSLLQELREQNNTLDTILRRFQRLIQSLSKKGEYTLVANIVLSKIAQLYQASPDVQLAAAEASEATQFVSASEIASQTQPARSFEQPASPVVSEIGDQPAIDSIQPDDPYYPTLQELIQHPNLLRIKKLLFATCGNPWVNDRAVLDRLNLSELLHQLIEGNPTMDHLKASLDRVVKTLNKPAEYTLIANILLIKLVPLYPSAEDQVPILTQPEQAAIAPSTYPLPAAGREWRQSSSLVDLRLQIMKYTNPLRAKILLYSTLHQPFSYGQQDWLSLKMYELEELLQNLLNLCPTLNELETRLRNTLQYLTNSEEETQAVSAIIKAVRPYYSRFQMPPKPTTLTDNLAESTHLIFEPDEGTQIVYASISDDEEEQTHQFYASPAEESFDSQVIDEDTGAFDTAPNATVPHIPQVPALSSSLPLSESTQVSASPDNLEPPDPPHHRSLPNSHSDG
ncbi:MAG: adenylate/guanylate cyclase domain-containing protein [Scytolyngbya sp. HA4215-MV1]|jgi:class 3 adenylate cyclase|nr:adenylate/guanylate cyclase domain-containing protein [Scytolyngbya sp. HA4215-MV1]